MRSEGNAAGLFVRDHFLTERIAMLRVFFQAPETASIELLGQFDTSCFCPAVGSEWFVR